MLLFEKSKIGDFSYRNIPMIEENAAGSGKPTETENDGDKPVLKTTFYYDIYRGSRDCRCLYVCVVNIQAVWGWYGNATTKNHLLL